MSLVAGGGRDELAELATQTGVVDLIIPRGGEGLKAALKGVATVPVIYAASGNCHVYVDASADLDDALAIVAQRQAPAARASATPPRRCSSTPIGGRRSCRDALAALSRGRASTLHGDERARDAGAGGLPVDAATDEDWDTEYLALELAVAVVDSAEEAIEHINRARQRVTRRRS